MITSGTIAAVFILAFFLLIGGVGIGLGLEAKLRGPLIGGSVVASISVLGMIVLLIFTSTPITP